MYWKIEGVTSTVLICLCFLNARSNEDLPVSIEDRIRALESQAIVPFMNRRAISGLEEKILKEMRSRVNTEIPGFKRDNSSGFIERVVSLDATLTRMCDQFDALVRGLSDEKGIREDEINNIRKSTIAFQRTIEEHQNELNSQIQTELQKREKAYQEERVAFENSIKDRLNQFENQIRSDLQEEKEKILTERGALQTSMREKQAHLEEHFEKYFKEEINKIQTSVEKLLNQFENRFNDEIEKINESLAEHRENLDNLEAKIQKRIDDNSENLIKLHDSFSTFEETIRCPSDWKKHGSMCYLFINNEHITWSSALQKCRSYGGTLVEIHNSDTYQFLNRFWDDDSWIGGTDHAEEGVWKWVGTNAEIQYFTWGSGQPNSQGGNQDCLEVYNGTYNDDDCDKRQTYNCQKDLL